MKFKLEKTKLKPFHLFYIGFFVLYFLGLYYFLYHVNGLQPFQVNVHFFSNVVGSISKRFLSEIAPYALIFYVLYYTKAVWKRVFLIALFEALFLINMMGIGFYYVTRSNFQFYILEGFNFHVFLSFFTPLATLIAILIVAVMAFLAVALFKIRNRRKDVWLLKKRLFTALLALLAIGGPFIPITYSAHMTVMNGDSLQKAFYRTIALEDSGVTTLLKEIKYTFSPPRRIYQAPTEDEIESVAYSGLNKQTVQQLSNPPKKIILVVVESLNQNFLSHYNDEIAGATPNLDRLFEDYPSIDAFYPSGPYTLQSLSTMLCGHTNSQQAQQSPGHVCAPKLLADAGYRNEFIRGASKYYVGENLHFKKFGYDTIFAKEELEQKYPDFKEQRADLYNTWGYTDDYLFDEAVEQLKNSQPEEKLFLTLLTVDTHVSGGRCAYPKTNADPKDPLLFSIRCFDRVFGEFIEELEREDLLTDDLAILLTSDQLYPAYKSVPGDKHQTSFILQPGRIPFLMLTKANVGLKAEKGSHIDIAATLLDLANLDVPAYYMGKSLISSAHTTPMGQDRYNGYMIVDGKFYPLSLTPTLKQYQKTEKPKGFFIKINDPDEIQTAAQEKIAEIETRQNQESGFYKWYYNKYFNLN